MLTIPFDYSSILTAFTVVGAGLAVAFLLNWLVTRSERFLITWALGVIFMAGGVLLYNLYTKTPSPALGAAGYTILLIGLSFVWGASREFRVYMLPRRHMAVVASASSILVSAPMLSGFDGISYIALNLVATAILLRTASEYWTGRAEAPLPISGLAIFYVLIGISFLPCAAILLAEGHWSMGHAPSNWAEDLNVVMSLAGLAGIGALSLALNQVRVARGHKREAETDALTGLLNRRALFNNARRTLNAPAALIIFDIDHFKQINDLHGHPTGDEVLRVFGEILLQSSRPDDLAIRVGGEEFAVLLPNSTTAIAVIVAEGIRNRFARRQFLSASGGFQSTVSAGIASVEVGIANLDILLRDADRALYEAKGNGRDRICVHSSPSSESYSKPANTASV